MIELGMLVETSKRDGFNHRIWRFVWVLCLLKWKIEE